MKKKRSKRDHGLDELVLPDRRVAEKFHSDMHRFTRDHEFESVEELEAFIQGVMESGEEPPGPRTPVERAQDLMYEAFGAQGPRRAELAREALEISPDCADAYVLLAEETAETPEQARDLYEQGVRAGERALGSEFFEEYAGRFWGILETRPYMRARAGLAETLWALDEFEEAAAHFEDLLRLNPGDNQGARFELARILLRIGANDRLRELLDRYPNSMEAEWAYARALLLFRTEGPSLAANVALGEAFGLNGLIALMLVGAVPIPRRLPRYFSPGDENEAAIGALFHIRAWVDTEGALDWLSFQLERAIDRDMGTDTPPETVEQIVEDLEAPVRHQPLLALKAAVERREEVTPYLLDMLDRSVDEILDRNAYWGHLYAMYLLAEFRETRAFPLVLRLLTEPDDEELDALYGDALTEDMQRILASVSGGDTAPLERVIENTEVNEYVRGAALDALVCLVVAGRMSRDDLVSYLGELLRKRLPREPDPLWADAVWVACEIGATELRGEIMAAFENGFVDESSIAETDVKTDFERWETGTARNFADSPLYQLVDDAVEEMRWMMPEETLETPKLSSGTGKAKKQKSKSAAKAHRKAAKNSRKKNRR